MSDRIAEVRDRYRLMHPEHLEARLDTALDEMLDRLGVPRDEEHESADACD